MNASDIGMAAPHFDFIKSLTWPASQLDDAIGMLALKSGYLSEIEPVDTLLRDLLQKVKIQERIEITISRLELEYQAVSLPYPEVSAFLEQGGPVLLRIRFDHSKDQQDEDENNARFLILLPTQMKWRGVKVIAPDGSIHRVKADRIRSALCYALEAPLYGEIDQLLEQANVIAERRDEVRLSILQARLQHSELSDCWLLRLSPSAPIWTLARHIGLRYNLLLSVAAQAADYFLYLAAYWLIGKAALGPKIDMGLLLGGLLLWFATFPFLVTKVWSDKMIGFNFGQLMKERLFYGVLRLDLGDVQRAGVGQFLAWVLESETLEEAILGGGLMALGLAVSLLTTVVSLFLINSKLLGLLLLFWLIVVAILSWRLLKNYLNLNEYYSDMTLDVLERIQGHQTRLVQEKYWYDEEDKAVSRYLKFGERHDQNVVRLLILMPSGWLLVGIFGIAVPFISDPNSFTQLGSGFLILLLTFQLLEGFAWGMIDFVRALAAWQLIAPIQQAASQPPAPPSLTPLPEMTRLQGMTPDDDENDESGSLILETQDLYFRYQAGGRPILAGCDLEIYAGDRMLLEGPSGGGKSTFASVLIGLLSTESGLLLLHGLDQHTVGMDAWRQRVVASPQFHQNYVLNKTFAFNLLMGRGWPPTEEDLAEAEQVCRELGLGELLDRMPHGLQEMVGEEGWRLSHGERSRLYIARTLLQKADLIILDESFASLDPENMEVALRCVLRRAPTLMVIAHP